MYTHTLPVSDHFSSRMRENVGISTSDLRSAVTNDLSDVDFRQKE